MFLKLILGGRLNTVPIGMCRPINGLHIEVSTIVVEKLISKALSYIPPPPYIPFI